MVDIEGYEGLYAADKLGKIWAYPKCNWSGRYLKSWLIGHGYEMVMLYRNKKPSKFLVHRLIAKTFVANPLNLPEVNHINSDIRDNRPENLEWVTSKENKIHAWKAGLYSHRGEKHHNSKLSDKEVRQIKRLLKKGSENKSQIARLFGVSPSTIGDISFGKMWGHIN